MNRLKLLRPPHPQVIDTATYYHVQALHRQEAIVLALGAVSGLEKSADELLRELETQLQNWASDSLIQGAYLREYHHWEVDTNLYFTEAFLRNGCAINCKKPRQSHVQYVIEQFGLFNVLEAPSISQIELARRNANLMKHKGNIEVTKMDFVSLCNAVSGFWEHVEVNEIFVSQQPFCVTG